MQMDSLPHSLHSMMQLTPLLYCAPKLNKEKYPLIWHCSNSTVTMAKIALGTHGAGTEQKIRCAPCLTLQLCLIFFTSTPEILAIPI